MEEFTPDLQVSDDGLNIREYAALFWQWAWLIALATMIAAISAYVFSRQMTPVFQARTTVLVNEAPATKATDYSSVMLSERLTRTYAQMINSDPVLNDVQALLGTDLPLKELKESISVQPLRDTQLIQVSVESTNPQLAAAIANTLVATFADQIQEIQAMRFAQSKQTLGAQLAEVEAQINQFAGEAQRATSLAERDRLESKVAQYREMYSSLLLSYEQVRLAEAQTISSVVAVEPAAVPQEPVRPKTLQNTLLAAVVGLLLSAGAVVAREALDDTLKTPEDVQRKLKLPVLGIISHHSAENERVVTEATPRSPVSEAFRTLRTNLTYASLDRPLRSVLVTSPEPGDGKTTVAANLAVVLAQSGRPVTLMDCDLRRPMAHRSFGLSNRQGISHLFFNPGEALNGSRQPTRVPQLNVLTTGPLPPNPAELLGSQRMAGILKEVQAAAEALVIDSPPALAVADASVLAPLVDGVLLVVRPGKTRMPVARQALEQLQRVGARVLGVVINDLELSRGGYGYRYRYHYHYYYKNYPAYQRYYSEPETDKRGRRKN